MNHQPYLDWLFAGDEPNDEPLTQPQHTALQDHLQSCEACRSLFDAWHKTEAHLQEMTMAAPQPGFTSRWQGRLEAERIRAHRRQIRAMLVFCVGGALLLFTALVILILPWVHSPNLLVWTWLYQVFTIYSFVELAQDLLAGLLQTATGVISITWLVILLGLLSELGVLWIVSFRLLTNPRRIMR